MVGGQVDRAYNTCENIVIVAYVSDYANISYVNSLIKMLLSKKRLAEILIESN